jgi:hypothetical protein
VNSLRRTETIKRALNEDPKGRLGAQETKHRHRNHENGSGVQQDLSPPFSLSG